MNYWLITHDFSDYVNNPNYIGIRVDKEKDKKLDGSYKFRFSDEFMIGDKIAYYCKLPEKASKDPKICVIGLFEVTEGPNDSFVKEWTSPVQYRIEPIIVAKDNPVSLAKLQEELIHFFTSQDGRKFNTNAKAVASKLQGSINKLTMEDFRIIYHLLNANLEEAILLGSEIISEEEISNQSLTTTVSTYEVLTEIKQRGGQERFRRLVFSHYNKCAICGIEGELLLEAAHIVSWKDDETKRGDISNGLALCSLCHKLFDNNILGISEEYTIWIDITKLKTFSNHPFLDLLKTREGEFAFLPANPQVQPSKENIRKRIQNT